MCNSIISSIKHITYCYYGSGDCIVITNRKNKRVSIMRYKKIWKKIQNRGYLWYWHVWTIKSLLSWLMYYVVLIEDQGLVIRVILSRRDQMYHHLITLKCLSSIYVNVIDDYHMFLKRLKEGATSSWSIF